MTDARFEHQDDRTSMINVTHFPSLADPGVLLDEFVPQMAELVSRPHLEHEAEWLSLRDRLDVIFAEHGWTGDESRVVFDLLVELAHREHTAPARQPA